jgi:hypothetical protein
VTLTPSELAQTLKGMVEQRKATGTTPGFSATYGVSCPARRSVPGWNSITVRWEMCMISLGLFMRAARTRRCGSGC